MGAIAPEYLKPGDTVALIAPARAVTPEEMQPFKDWAAQQGWKLKEGKHLYGRYNQFSGSDEERAADLTEALLDKSVKAVFCGRGGYGCMRLIPHLPDSVWHADNLKWIVGFSDITTLHLEAAKNGWQTIHGPMAIHFHATHNHTDANSTSLLNALTGKTNEVTSDGLFIENAAAFDGEIIGGNLSLIYAACGTNHSPDTKGKVLFIEDLDEYLYHIDRMTMSLKHSGLFNEIKGLIVGGMTDMKDNAVPFGMNVTEIIQYHCSQMGFPIIFDFPAGHTQKNVCIKLGAHITFDGYKIFQC